MRGLFDKLEIKNQSVLSKIDKKKYNTRLGGWVDVKGEYKIVSMSTKLRLIKEGDSYVFFEYFGKVIPTLTFYNSKSKEDNSKAEDKDSKETLFKKVFLDEGAMGPLTRGADVMAPGILKYISRCESFEKEDIIAVEIENQGIFAFGLALVSYKEMNAQKEGPVIDILHVRGDKLDRNSI